MAKGIKILIVEDDENLRFLVVHRLKAEEYDVLEVGDGEAAEKLILTEKPDIVLLAGCFPVSRVLKFAKRSVNRALKT